MNGAEGPHGERRLHDRLLYGIGDIGRSVAREGEAVVGEVVVDLQADAVGIPVRYGKRHLARRTGDTHVVLHPVDGRPPRSVGGGQLLR
ncbi:hypothetical protein GCM10022248_53610 [Nonomuraea soli]